MTTNKPILASFGEILEFEYSMNQLKLNEVDYKIDYETNTLKLIIEVLKITLLECMR